MTLQEILLKTKIKSMKKIKKKEKYRWDKSANKTVKSLLSNVQK